MKLSQSSIIPKSALFLNPKSALFWLLVVTSITEYSLMHQVGEVLYFLAKKASIVVEALIRANCTGWNYFRRNIYENHIIYEGYRHFFRYQPLSIWQTRIPTQFEFETNKTEKSKMLSCFWAYVGQPHNHRSWATPMPFTSINPINPRANP